MKRKLIVLAVMVIAIMTAFAISVSAATYYVDGDGALVDSTSDKIAYEYELSSKGLIPDIYLHDTTVTKIVIPDMPDFTGTVQLQSGYSASLGVYAIADKEAKTTNLMTQITEVEIYENMYLDGAYTVGVFAGYTSLEKISFYAKVSVASKGGFFQNCNALCELHFYGQDIAVPSTLINSLKHTNEVTIAFHEGSSGTLSTGSETLPTFSTLNNWKIIINPNITPSNMSDTRLGHKWGAGVLTTTGWELIMACDPSLYTQQELEALKTSHCFRSRAEFLEGVSIKEATVMSYCDALYNGAHNGPKDDNNCETSVDCTRCSFTIKEASAHNIKTVITYENGFGKDGKKLCDCVSEGCTVVDTDTVAPAFFECLGYSVPEDNRYDGLYVAFNVSNLNAYIEYVSVMGEFKYGIAIANAKGVGSLISLEGDECVFSAEKGLSADMTGSEYTTFKLSIMGFNESVADTLDLVIAAYAAADYGADGEAEVKFIQHELTNESNKIVNGFNTVSLNRAYYNLYPSKKED